MNWLMFFFSRWCQGAGSENCHLGREERSEFRLVRGCSVLGSLGTWLARLARLTATPAMPWGGLQDVGECSGRRRFLRHDMSWDTLWDTSWHVVRHGGDMYQEQNLRCFTSKLILENARKVKQIDDLQCTFSVLSVRLQMMFGIESCRSRDDLL
jgi:hypothetical protein